VSTTLGVYFTNWAVRCRALVTREDSSGGRPPIARISSAAFSGATSCSQVDMGQKAEVHNHTMSIFHHQSQWSGSHFDVQGSCSNTVLPIRLFRRRLPVIEESWTRLQRSRDSGVALDLCTSHSSSGWGTSLESSPTCGWRSAMWGSWSRRYN